MFVILGLTILLIIDAFIAINEYYAFLEIVQTYSKNDFGIFEVYPWIGKDTLYNSWVGGRVSGIIPYLFYFAMPVFCVIPYSASFLLDEKSGYIKTLATLTSKRKYLYIKHLAVFISGFITAVIPMIINMILVSCFVPAYPPDNLIVLYYGVNMISLLGNIYYMFPMFTVFVSVLIAGLFAGAWATIPLVISYFVKNTLCVLFAPYLVLLFIIKSLETAFVFRVYAEGSILNLIRPAYTLQTEYLWVYLLYMAVILIVPIFITVIKGVKYDVY